MIAALVARPRRSLRQASGALVLVLLATATPLLAQNAPVDPEARMRRLEAEVRALQRQVFPGSDGKFFTAEVANGAAASSPAGTPASTPVSDLLTRMESVESQISRLTAQSEETANRVSQMEARLVALTPAPATAAVAGDPPATMLGGVSSPATTSGNSTVSAPAAATAAASAAALAPAVAKPSAAGKPAAASKPAVAAKPSPQRLAAVQKIEKPQSSDAGDDEYSYGFRLWEAKFYPEARQQLQIYVDKYSRHKMISYGRNLLGRAYLDDGKPYEAGGWFVKNYQADKAGARAADSLLNLSEAMRQLKDTNRSCIALAEFGEVYPKEAAGRLKAQYDAVRSKVKCD